MKVAFFILISWLILGLNIAHAELSISGEGAFTKSNIDQFFSRYEHDPNAVKTKKAMLAALPQADLLFMVRDRLPQIIESYISTSRDTSLDPTLSRRFLTKIQETFPSQQESDISRPRLTVSFMYSADGRFQVEGIEPDRMAYNDGYNIYFNVSALNKNPDLTISEATQLWLHEILHLDQDIPLEVRDKWAANVAQFVKTYSVERRLNDQKRILSLILPGPSEAPPESFAFELKRNGYFQKVKSTDFLFDTLSKKILLLEQTPESTKYYEKAYLGMMLVADNTTLRSDFYGYSGTIFRWPHISFKNVRWNSQGVLQIEYSSKDVPYIASNQTFHMVQSGDPVKANLEQFRSDFRLNVQPEQGKIDLQRNYSTLIKDGTFETYRIVDSHDRRFLSLRLKMDGAFKKTKNTTAIQLVGKDIKSQQLLSISVQKIKAISPDEVQLHLEIPLRNFELHQVLVPVVADNGTYSELSIKPLRPESILGTLVDTSAPAQINFFSIQKKQSDQDKVKAHLDIQTTRKIQGVTLDLVHRLKGQDVSLNNLPLPSERPKNEVYLFNSRKYFIASSQLKMNGTTVSFDIPEEKMEQITLGPEITKEITWAYKQTYRKRYKTIEDLQDRRIVRAWVHYTDGAIEEIKSRDLPRRDFSLTTVAPTPQPIIRCDGVFRN